MSRALDQAWHRTAYTTLQQMRGRPVGRFIRELQAREQLQRPELERMISSELEDQLRFARAKVPLYSSGPWSQALAHGDPTRLSSWPILDRSTVRARGSELLVVGLRAPRAGLGA